jgi:hypothetical protein
VEIKTRRLPKSERGARPRIHLELGQKNHTLSVLPSLVYGDPPEAKIVEGKLVHLQGPIPVRDEAEERALVARLRDELNLIPGRQVDFDGPDAIRFATRLQTWSGATGDERRRLFGKGRLVPKLSLDDKAFDVIFELSADDEGEASAEGPAASRRRRRRDPRVARRPPARAARRRRLGAAARRLAARFGARVADLLVARRDEDKELERAALPALAELCDALDHPRPARASSFSRRSSRASSPIPEAPLPAI